MDWIVIAVFWLVAAHGWLKACKTLDGYPRLFKALKRRALFGAFDYFERVFPTVPFEVQVGGILNQQPRIKLCQKKLDSSVWDAWAATWRAALRSKATRL